MLGTLGVTICSLSFIGKFNTIFRFYRVLAIHLLLLACQLQYSCLTYCLDLNPKDSFKQLFLFFRHAEVIFVIILFPQDIFFEGTPSMDCIRIVRLHLFQSCLDIVFVSHFLWLSRALY